MLLLLSLFFLSTFRRVELQLQLQLFKTARIMIVQQNQSNKDEIRCRSRVKVIFFAALGGYITNRRKGLILTYFIMEHFYWELVLSF